MSVLGLRCVARIAGPASSAAAVAVLLALAVSPAGAAPQGPWVQPAVDLSASAADKDAQDPQIATAPDGTATVVWHRWNGSGDGDTAVIQAATRPPGGAFSAPVEVSVAGRTAIHPQISGAADGSVTVVWQRDNGSNTIIQAATRPPGGNFGLPADLSAPGRDAGDPQIEVAPDGAATAVWRRSDGSKQITQAASRPPGGVFGAPVNLSAPGQNAFGRPQVASDPDGAFTAVWSREDGSNDIVQAATRPPGGSFGAPVDLSATGQDNDRSQIAIAPDGTATVVWRRSDGTNTIIQAATRPPGGIFGAPITISTIGQDAQAPQIAAASDGTATAVWFGNVGGNFIIQAATRPPGGSFGAPVNLSAIGQNAFNPQITVGPDGTATVVWQRSNGSNNIIQAATRPPGAPFGSPVNLSANGRDAEQAQIASFLDGAAIAVWNRFNGTNEIVQSISTAQPSLLLGVAKNGSGKGTVTSSPAGIDCGNDCAASYLSFTKVTLAATPENGSSFEGWGGACEEAAGNTCELTMLDDENVTATFGKAGLKVTRVKPRKPKVKRGRKVKLKVTAKNTGDATANKAKLCVKLKKSVKKKLKPKGKNCKKLGSLAPGKAKTRTFKLKATGRAKRGKKYKAQFRLSADGPKAAKAAVGVKVR